MDVSRLKDAYTAADADGLEALNDGLIGTIVAVMDLDGKVLLQYDDGRAVAVYEESGFVVFEDLEVPQC